MLTEANTAPRAADAADAGITPAITRQLRRQDAIERPPRWLPRRGYARTPPTMSPPLRARCRRWRYCRDDEVGGRCHTATWAAAGLRRYAAAI